MGLKFSVTDKSGRPSPEAYAKASFYSFDDVAKTGRLVLEVYNTKEDKDAGKSSIRDQKIELNFSVNSGVGSKTYEDVANAIEKYGPKKVSYVLAKKLERLAEAEDVLEDGQEAITDVDVELEEEPEEV